MPFQPLNLFNGKYRQRMLIKCKIVYRRRRDNNKNINNNQQTIMRIQRNLMWWKAYEWTMQNKIWREKKLIQWTSRDWKMKKKKKRNIQQKKKTMMEKIGNHSIGTGNVKFFFVWKQINSIVIVHDGFIQLSLNLVYVIRGSVIVAIEQYFDWKNLSLFFSKMEKVFSYLH